MPRLVVPAYPHHVTQRGARRQTTFFAASDYRAYLALLKALKGEANVDVLAYCLMPNHVHVVAVPRSGEGLARLFGTAHQRYARRVNDIHGWNGHLWQERFYSCVLDEAHLLAAVRYIELNPVRAGLCHQPEEWHWSSVHAHIGTKSDSLLSDSPVIAGIRDWRGFLNDERKQDLVHNIRTRTKTGRPAGSARFIGHLEVVTGKRLRRRKPGPRPGSA